MNKSEILCIGLGQCGGILANGMKEKNSRYSVAFINSSMGDTRGMKFANSTNVFIYSGSDGSGGDRNRTKIYFENDKMRLASFLRKFSQFKFVKLFSSLDGGSGSGSLCRVTELINKMLPNVDVEIIGVLPKLSLPNTNLQNTLDCISELSRIGDMYSSIRFINNDNCGVKKGYSEINEKAIEILDLTYGMIGHDSEGGSIDESDLENVCTASGYGLTLKLDLEVSNLQDAISKAKIDSVFAVPNDLSCDYSAINISKREGYDLDRIANIIHADYRAYKTYNNKGINVIALGGCQMPNEEIQSIQSELDERELERKVSGRNKGFNLNIKSSNNTNNKPKKQERREEVDLFDDDFMDKLLDDDFDL